MPHVTSSNGLDALSDFFGLTRSFATCDERENVGDAHGALEDAILTGEVLNEMMRLVSYSNLNAFLQLLDASPGEVRGGEVLFGFRAAGKFNYPNLNDIPSEVELLDKLQKAELARQKAGDKRQAAEDAKAAFLSQDPIPWSNHVLTSGDTVYFSSFVSDGFEDAVNRELERLGVDGSKFSGKTTLLVLPDDAVEDSAKMRDCFSFKTPVAVTNYSNFLRNNPQFPPYNPAF